jgi:hypothetical protein
MATHDFARLSSYDFEELIRDLLQEEWQAPVENFTPGRDQGIDLRCHAGTEQEIVVQCKHMPKSKAAALINHLKTDELPKVRALAPSRYVMATSVGLTPANKKSLSTLFHPYVKAASDILGRERINALLRKHPKVETSNFKLWFTSTAVMNRVLHAAEKLQSDFEVERVNRMLPLFVQSEAFPKAREILEETRIVVISGPPGIGKSTLADMLLFAYVERGYEPIIIRDKAHEAKRLLDRKKKQIIYFDDFLGETFLGDRHGYQAQDADLLSFMDAVRHSEQTLFVLTTREHILRSAVSASEKLNHSTILSHRTVLELQSYSRAQRARILYNHLYFSDLPVEYRMALLVDGFYLKVIEHPNFSPRTISFLASHLRVRHVLPEDFSLHVRNMLDSPEEIWKHAFERQISESSRSLLLVLAADSYSSRLTELEVEWESFHRHRAQEYNFSRAPTDFRQALNELEGTFVTISGQDIKFANPSVRDFLGNLYRFHTSYAADLIAAAFRFDQIEFLFRLATQRPSPELDEAVRRLRSRLSQVIRPLLYVPYMRWSSDSEGKTVGVFIDTHPEGRLSALVAWAEETQSVELLDIASEVATCLCDAWPGRSYIDINATINVIEKIDEYTWCQARGGADIIRKLLDRVLLEMSVARYFEWKRMLQLAAKSAVWTEEDEIELGEVLSDYQKSGVGDEASDCSTAEERAEMREGLIELKSNYGIDFSKVISRLEEDIEPDNNESEEDGTTFNITSRQRTDVTTDDQIHALFRTLIH